MPKLFNELRERLLRAGMAPRHVRRYLAELDDHLDELQQQGSTLAEALARLGTAEELAKPMLDRREFRSWTARAPWVVMVLGPIVTMIASELTLVFTVVGLVLLYQWIAPWEGKVEPMPVQNFVHAATAFAVLVLPLMIGWGAAAVAIQQRLRPLWPLIGLTLFAVVSGTFGAKVTFPKTLAEPGELSLGFSWLKNTLSASLNGADLVDISPTRWFANLVLLIAPYLALRLRAESAPRDEVDAAGSEKAA